MNADEPLTFLASIAPLQSAFMIASDGGARIKLDIPESEMPAIVRLLLLRGQTLRITVEAIVENAEQAPMIRTWKDTSR